MFNPPPHTKFLTGPLLLAHPVSRLCSVLIERMVEAVRGDANALSPMFLELNIQTPEMVR